MIKVENGKTTNVNTTSKDIDVIFYCSPAKPSTELQDIGAGSMTDKGKELIDQARKVQLNRAQSDVLLKSVGNILNRAEDAKFNRLFREDKLSEANQERQKELNKGLAEQKVIKQWESKWQQPAFQTTEGKKETVNKADYSEINLGILDLMADRFSANKGKYEHGNSKKPLDKQQILWALFRHVKKMVQPIEGDEENFKDHLAACLTNCSILLDQLEIKK